MNDDIPIHYWQGDASMVTVYKKTSLYGAEKLCQIYSGSFSSPNRNIDVREYANALCEALERKRQLGDDAQ